MPSPKLTNSPAGREAWRHLHDLLFSEASQERMHTVCESLDLTPGLMKALLSIEPGFAKPMRSLSDQWRCDASYVTSLVDALEERGLVERQTHPTDRRAKTIVLTDKGELTRDELFRKLHEPPEWFTGLSHAEQRELRDLLRKVVIAAGLWNSRQ